MLYSIQSSRESCPPPQNIGKSTRVHFENGKEMEVVRIGTNVISLQVHIVSSDLIRFSRIYFYCE